MGFMTAIKANKALRLQKEGKRREAEKLYEEAFAEGLRDPRFLLPYALMIIRDGQYQKAKEFLVANQRVQMAPGQRIELLVYYATCCFRLGSTDKGISVLEQQFRKTETGLLYQTLGYLYVDKYDQDHRPDFEALAAEAAQAAENEAQERISEAGNAAEARDGGSTDAGENDAQDSTAETFSAAEAQEAAGEEAAENETQDVAGLNDAEETAPKLSPEEEWEAGIEKAEAFIRKSVEYDDEDPVCLDNLGEFLYRVRGDRAGAKEWFDRAIALKENQIDTLYFLSRYDLEAGDKKAALEKLEKAAGGRFSPLNYSDQEMITREIEQLKGEL